jgi:CubicO group peptidase (beta-lactamase class C family)
MNQQRSSSPPADGPGPAGALSDTTLAAFEADVEAAMQTFQMLGAAVALVQDNRTVYARGFGVRDLQTNAPVSPHTRFRIASNTKSMTSLLAATFVDQGVLDWESPILGVWPEFHAPTPALTQSLRLRDLLGMGSGVAESPTIEFFMSAGTESALDQLRSIAYLPVIAPPDTEYYYNNTLTSAAGYLGPITQGTAPERLEDAYAALVAERIFEPIGMTTAAIADDPRPLGDDYAIGYTRDLFGRLSPVPFVSVAGAAPAGAAIASATDMARYLITQMNGGVAPDGTRVVSSANLAQTHRPGIAVPPDATNALPAVVLPDTIAMHYCLGWFDQTFKDGRHLIWHGGAIDGFGSQMGFFPADRLGYVLLTNLEPTAGALFHIAVQSSLLSRLYGLNQDLPALMADAVPDQAQQIAALAAQTRPVDPAGVRAYLGLYSDGFLVRLDDSGALHLEHDIRSVPVLAMPDGGYVVVDGPGVIAQKTITFTDDAGYPKMAIEGFEPVRWLTAG